MHKKIKTHFTLEDVLFIELGSGVEKLSFRPLWGSVRGSGPGFPGMGSKGLGVEFGDDPGLLMLLMLSSSRIGLRAL